MKIILPVIAAAFAATILVMPAMAESRVGLAADPRRLGREGRAAREAVLLD